MRLGSLCTGIGGLDLAVEAHFDAELAWYCEVEPAPCVVLEREYPGVPNYDDLTILDWSTVPRVDVLTAGYPCQPFSHAGKRKGTSDERHLWPYIGEAVRVLRPRFVVLENVRGHLSLGFDSVLGELAEAGFDAEWCVLRASDVGTPHQRARLWIVATDTDALRPQGRYLTGSGEGVGAQWHGPARSDPEAATPTDAAHVGHEWGREARRRGDGPADSGAVAWGQYEPAIRRWERCLGRPAPRPTDAQGRLNPALVEWMMGYPQGWVDGLTRTQALKALGNAVVPQQAALALRVLAPVVEGVAA